MALPQRNRDGTLARKRLIGFTDTVSGYIDRADALAACCCETFGWWLLTPCSTDPPYWWNCNEKILGQRYDAGCRWVAIDKLKEFSIAAGDPVWLDFILYDSVSEACYRPAVAIPEGTNGRAFPPYGGFDATDFLTLVGTGACCDFPDDCGGLHCEDCSDPGTDCDQDPPVDPPPDPDPSDCDDCGETAICTNCGACQPAYGIRVTLSGLTNCACVGPCGIGPSYEYSRLKDGETFNGTYDLTPTGDGCDWKYLVAKTLLTGAPGDGVCGTENTTSFAIHLRKIDAATWALAIYKNDPDFGTDPRTDGSNDFDQARAFSGSGTVTSFQCMTVPTMINVLGCGCNDTATSDGRFNVCTGGTATFTILCAA